MFLKVIGPITVSLLLLSASVSAQENQETDELLKKLQPNSISTGKPAVRLSIEELMARTQNRIQVEERLEGEVGAQTREPIAPELLDLPTAEIAVTFDYNSSEVTSSSLPNVVKMARILNDPSLANSKFLIAGHTDARGPNNYNLELSKRRADTIRGLLVNAFAVPENRIVSFGFGEEQLKNASNPEDGSNRRVEVINVDSLSN